MGTPGRQMTLAVGAIAVGAVLMLVAAGREWLAVATAAPLPTRGRTGGDLLPWLSAAGWMALAGAGATVAVRGWLRRLVGGLLVLTGGAALAGCGWATTVAGAAWGWPLVAGAGGLLVAGAAAVSVVRASDWPALGARYDRRAEPTASGAAKRPDQLWDALDRGEDPTA